MIKQPSRLAPESVQSLSHDETSLMFVPISPKLKSLGKMCATKKKFSSRHLDSAQVLNVEKLKTNCLLARKL